MVVTIADDDDADSDDDDDDICSTPPSVLRASILSHVEFPLVNICRQRTLF